MLIFRELEDRGITTPAAISEALGMPAAEATKLLRDPSRRFDPQALLCTNLDTAGEMRRTGVAGR
jgi:hypothetical protein